MEFKFIEEPELEFGISRHVDIKFGIKNFNVLDFNHEDAPRSINLGIVGAISDIDKFKEWIERCKTRVNKKESSKFNLFPSFPGFSMDHSFFSEIILSDATQSSISLHDLESLKEFPIKERTKKAAELYAEEVDYLVSKNHRVDIILCIISKELGRMLVGIDDKLSSNRKFDFRSALKAYSLQSRTPLQIVLPTTYDNSAKKIKLGYHAEGSVQDEATRAWNFFTALYYKAGGVPWRLLRRSNEFQTCYIGISFYKSLDEKTIQTSLAQVFNERGEGIIIRGGHAIRSKEDKQIHLEVEGAYMLAIGALKKYKKEHKTLPARVVIHKTSDFDQNEIDGFIKAIRELNIELFDFLSISKCMTRLHRVGKYPPLRGTFWELDDEQKILYTTGSIDFFQTYPGLYVPKTLKMKIAYSEQSAIYLAQEILALTKMNWNNTQINNSLPITLKAAKQVGEILKYREEGDYESSYCFYM